MSNPITVDIKALTKGNTEHFMKYFKPETRDAKAIIFLEGGHELPVDDTDGEYLFRQESNFFYLFGVKESNFSAIINMKGERTLVVPEQGETLQIFLGPNLTLQDVKDMYGVENAIFSNELKDYLKKIEPSLIYLYTKGVNSDSGLEPKPLTVKEVYDYKVEETELHDILFNARTVKTPLEHDFMKRSINGTAEAHRQCMKFIRPGMMEGEVEAEFYKVAYGKFGMRSFCYFPICASGKNSSIMHYGHAGRPNDKIINDGEMILMDVGTGNHHYATDLTLTYPANGKFTPEQKEVYDIVLKANRECEAYIKPGLHWYDVHNLANRVILKGLKEAGFINGDLDEMFNNDVHFYFMPHGIGHLIGLDTHDVGGFTGIKDRSTNCSLARCRSNRVLEEGNCYTVEPGIYFIPFLLESAFKNDKIKKYFNEEKIRKFWNFGGVRIEDDVYVTKDGCEVMDEGVPRTTEEIEAFMKH